MLYTYALSVISILFFPGYRSSELAPYMGFGGGRGAALAGLNRDGVFSPSGLHKIPHYLAANAQVAW